MFTLLPELEGRHIRLEPLQPRHAAGLAEAAASDPDLYRLTVVPQTEAEAAAYIESALARRDQGTAAPFAVVRVADGAVIGSTRIWDLVRWGWPTGHPRHGREAPDICEIGYTWLARPAIGTAANTEMKLLMLGHAFETWQVHCVCLHTDARNERSRRAMEKMGARFEGILRAHRLAAELTPRDSARYSVTAAEWPEVKRGLADRLAARAGRAPQATGARP